MCKKSTNGTKILDLIEKCDEVLIDKTATNKDMDLDMDLDSIDEFSIEDESYENSGLEDLNSKLEEFDSEEDKDISNEIKKLNKYIKEKDMEIYNLNKEHRNIEILKKAEIELKVRIGSKVLTLSEIESLKEDSTLELDQLTNDPLEILINNVFFGLGEVVIVDGNYGIQITKIGKEGN